MLHRILRLNRARSLWDIACKMNLCSVTFPDFGQSDFQSKN